MAVQTCGKWKQKSRLSGGSQIRFSIDQLRAAAAFSAISCAPYFSRPTFAATFVAYSFE